MKKFMFSAVAMIAFVGSGWASDIAEKEIEVQNLKSISVQESESAKLFREDCDLVKFRAYNLARDLGYSVDSSNDYSYIYYFNCVSRNLSAIGQL